MQPIEWPFRAAEALDAGAVTFRELRRLHTPAYPGVWVPRGVELSPVQRARAAWLWSGRQGVLGGLSAAALLGAKWIDVERPAELIHTNRRAPPRLRVHTDVLLPGETQAIADMPVTTPARTAFDLGRRLGLTEGVQRIDALMNATDVKAVEVQAVITGHPGARGLRQLRATLRLVDGGAESPYESLTRLLLVQAGFPRPQTQISVCDEYGYVIARIDMGWPQWRVGVDFEGAHHWTDPRQRDWDVERYAKLPELGWNDIRVTARMLHTAPRVFLNRVGAALTARGCPKTW
ncbi:hypothetical protein [Mycobacterium talmoniae]|uniref:DUF559 domain-containing protein n=1 Tax=Mycobacterium talmoniae TaxID=1858794 RepID=A0A1S1NFC7_9MYCO|nr:MULTISPECIES: hypothetical protein [Mycobacterium]OHV04382.1 hypothetical protein BKN37_10420 [Mycobacterium talmoniae]PQM44262.1 hypothetical protein C1Y40_05580 [Mycobacterium talmoniae]TDH51730.1 hypothetical protein E2F47_15555 [Mycobacterium eburneum]